MNDDEKPLVVESFLDKHIGSIAVIGVYLIIVCYFVYGWYFPEPMPDCGYMDSGCQGDNRWGQ